MGLGRFLASTRKGDQRRLCVGLIQHPPPSPPLQLGTPMCGPRPQSPSPGTTCKRQRTTSPPPAPTSDYGSQIRGSGGPVAMEKLMPNAAQSVRLRQYASSGMVSLISNPKRPCSNSLTVLTNKHRCLGTGNNPSVRSKRRGSQSSGQAAKRQSLSNVAINSLSLARPPEL